MMQPPPPAYRPRRGGQRQSQVAGRYPGGSALFVSHTGQDGAPAERRPLQEEPMKRYWGYPLLLAATLSAALGHTPSAEAASALTPALYVPSGYWVTCAMMNVGKTPAVMAFDVVNSVGVAVGGAGSGSPIDPGEVLGGGSVAPPVAGFYYCRGIDVSARRVRMTM